MAQDKRLILDWTKVHDVFPVEKHLTDMSNQLTNARQKLLSQEPAMTGWVDYVEKKSFDFWEECQDTIERVNAHSDAVVVIGVGGSFLGALSVYEATQHAYKYLRKQSPVLFWAGYHLNQEELSELIDALEGYTPSLLVISKSGSTTESALSFRILKAYLDDRFGKQESDLRTFVITDPQEGALRKVVGQKNLKAYGLPSDIGGRYSIFSPVGILPLALGGVDVKSFLEGARQAYRDVSSPNASSFETSPALLYAALRNILYENGYKIESLCVWSPKLRFVTEWWKQLFGESDGKNKTGIFPSSAVFSADLHSLGQYFQEGERTLFATHLKVTNEFSRTKASVKRTLEIPGIDFDDGFGFVEGRELSSIQTEAQQGTFLAHSDGQVPTLVWELPELNPWWLGYWMYTNLFACAVGGLARGIDPFNQPGVESYKKNMFALLGHPNFLDSTQKIKSRIQASKRLRSIGLFNQNH